MHVTSFNIVDLLEVAYTNLDRANRSITPRQITNAEMSSYSHNAAANAAIVTLERYWGFLAPHVPHRLATHLHECQMDFEGLADSIMPEVDFSTLDIILYGEPMSMTVIGRQLIVAYK